jgi:hypothetical protein
MKTNRDFIVLGPETPHGQACIRHRPDESIHVGVLRSVKEGVPIVAGAELVKVRPAGDGTYDVTSIYGGSSEESSNGPAQVATDEYRDGWDRVFGSKGTVAQA